MLVKYINGSAIKEALIETEIDESTTMEQIKARRYYKRWFEAMLIIYLALYSLYIKNLFGEKIILKIACEEATEAFKNRASLSTLVNDLANLSYMNH